MHGAKIKTHMDCCQIVILTRWTQHLVTN